MTNRAHYPRVTNVLKMMPKAFVQHWAARVERERAVKMAADMSPAKLKEWAAGLEWCTDRKCNCASGQVLTDAGDKGTEFHTAVEDYLKGREPKPGAAEHAFRRFLKWWEKQSIEIVEQELKLHSDIWRYKGTTDVIFKRAGHDGLWIGDWKTSNNMDATHELQIGAYAGAWLEMKGLDWDVLAGGLVARFDKNAKPKKRAMDEHWLTRDELKERFTIFTSLRRPYDFALRNGMLTVGG